MSAGIRALDDLEATLKKGRELLATSQALLVKSRETKGIINLLLEPSRSPCLPPPVCPQAEQLGAR